MPSFVNSFGRGDRCRIACSSAQTGSTPIASARARRTRGVLVAARTTCKSCREVGRSFLSASLCSLEDRPRSSVYEEPELAWTMLRCHQENCHLGAASSVRQPVRLFVRRARLHPVRAGLLSGMRRLARVGDVLRGVCQVFQGSDEPERPLSRQSSGTIMGDGLILPLAMFGFVGLMGRVVVHVISLKRARTTRSRRS